MRAMGEGDVHTLPLHVAALIIMLLLAVACERRRDTVEPRTPYLRGISTGKQFNSARGDVDMPVPVIFSLLLLRHHCRTSRI
jgi:hypothetical protein